jgi:hypothetical protein
MKLSTCLANKKETPKLFYFIVIFLGTTFVQIVDEIVVLLYSFLDRDKKNGRSYTK